MYKKALSIDLPWLDKVIRAKQPQRLPVVLTRTEVQAVLTRMSGTYGLMAHLLKENLLTYLLRMIFKTIRIQATVLSIQSLYLLAPTSGQYRSFAESP